MKTILIAAFMAVTVAFAQSQSIEETFEAGKKSFYSDDFDTANKYFMEILNSQNDDYLTHYYKGLIYEIYFDNDKALTELGLAIGKRKSFGEAYYRRGILREKTGDTAGAVSDYSMAIKNGEKTADAYFNRASLYQEAGENEKAVNDYSKAIELNPQDDISFYNRGKLYMALGEKEDAIQDFETAVKIDKAWETELRELIKILSQ